ncbi:MAG: class I SAM-dependent methyltransferase [Alicyclobacillus sp.]|nr:class I SAM-dependent methyltransferase [Alicyclobacillus sp.]
MVAPTVELSRRLQGVAEFVPAGCRFADIGTDHAFLPIYLVQTGQITRAVACDIKAGPVNAARRNVHRYGLDELIDVRQGDGLSPLQPGEVEVVAIAGLGGIKAVELLRRGLDVTRRLQRVIVQPMNGGGYVRRFFREHGFGLAGEVLLAEDGRFYTVLAGDRQVDVHAGYHLWPPADHGLCDEYGPYILRQRDPLTVAYMQAERVALARVLQQLAAGRSAAAQVRAHEIAEQLAEVDRWLSGGKFGVEDVGTSG